MGSSVESKKCNEQTCPPGKILLAQGTSRQMGKARIVDPVKGTTCSMSDLPLQSGQATGGIMHYNGIPSPVVCGRDWIKNRRNVKGQPKCFIYNKKATKWIAKTTTAAKNRMTSVSLGKWLLLIGGHINRIGYQKATYFMTGGGDEFQGPNLKTARGLACAAVIKDEGSHKQFVVIGGKGPDNKNRNDMEVFDCDMRGSRPSCKMDTRQTPQLSQTFVYFGCGVLETEDGGKVLLVMQGRKSTEILDLKATNWVWNKRKFHLP